MQTTDRPSESLRAGIYPSLEARARVMSIYDEKLAHWPVPFEERDVRTRYGSTHVVISGASEAPPVVLVHMAGCAAVVWRSLVASLANDHRLYAVDTIGDAGKSELDDLGRYPKGGADYSAWLGDVWDALRLGAADLVAGSMGGWIALHFASREPERVRRLVLLGPMGLPSWSQTLLVLFRLATVGVTPSASKAERLLSWAIGNSPAVRAEVGDWMNAVLESHCKTRLGSPLPLPASRLELIEAPTLVVLGGNDGPIGNADRAAGRARRHIPDVDVEILRDAGHAMSVEAADQVGPRVAEFLAATALERD
jgi:pimeloyl-ACP methyl ester carboxylesterase